MALSQEALSEAASTLAGSRHSWVPFTTPSVSEAARALAQKRNATRKPRATSRTPTRAKASTKSHTRAHSKKK